MDTRLFYVNGKLQFGPNTVQVLPAFSPVVPILASPTISPSSSFTRIKSITNPNDDPDMQKSIIKYFYQKLRDVYFYSSMAKLLGFVKIQDNKPRLVSSYEEYKNNNSPSNPEPKIKYIMDEFFSKYDLEVLLHKVVDNNGYNWYDLKEKHSHKVKKEIYKKIRHILEKKAHI